MSTETHSPRSNKAAIVFSALFPGLGQLYGGNFPKGAAFFFASIALDIYLLPEGYWGILKGEVDMNLSLYFRLVLLGSFRMWAVIDADRTVKRKNAEEGGTSLKP